MVMPAAFAHRSYTSLLNWYTSNENGGLERTVTRALMPTYTEVSSSVIRHVLDDGNANTDAVNSARES